MPVARANCITPGPSPAAPSSSTLPRRLILARSQYSGPISVVAKIDNGGAAVIAGCKIEVTEPKTDPWVQRVPEKDEKPEDNQFYARDDKNEGTLYYNGGSASRPRRCS